MNHVSYLNYVYHYRFVLLLDSKQELNFIEMHNLNSNKMHRMHSLIECVKVFCVTKISYYIQYTMITNII